jgi:hypothetical protein
MQDTAKRLDVSLQGGRGRRTRPGYSKPKGRDRESMKKRETKREMGIRRREWERGED